MVDPRVVGLPHAQWRPAQYEAFTKTLELHRNGGGVIITELPTGCGKSGVATALGSEDHVLVVVQNLGLLKQYETSYGFSIVMGKQEYKCVLPIKVNHWKIKYGKEPTASDCHYKDMSECVSSHDCPYLNAKRKVIESRRSACTYKYAVLSKHMKDRKGIMVFDECHLSVPEILDLSSVVIDSATIIEYDLTPVTSIGKALTNNAVLDDVEKEVVVMWCRQNLKILGAIDMFDALNIKSSRAKKIAELFAKLISLLESDTEVFYMLRNRISHYDGKRIDEIFFKPLDAGKVVEEMTMNKTTKLLMSATIGNPVPLIKQLGIEKYSKYEFPHPIPVKNRPIYDLEIPQMTRANLERWPALYKMQAIKISNFIGKFDPTWRGIILTTSNYKINKLRELLSDSIKDRVFEFSRTAYGVKERIKEFTDTSKPGDIAIGTTQGWGSGISLDGDKGRFSIIAGVEFTNPSDPYDVARQERPGGWSYSQWSAYNGVIQGIGRVSRGELDNAGNYVTNIAALADGSSTTNLAYSYYNNWFKEAIVK